MKVKQRSLTNGDEAQMGTKRKHNGEEETNYKRKGKGKVSIDMSVLFYELEEIFQFICY